MKVGDLVKRVKCPWVTGIVIGFNKKGEGGKDFVHVFFNGKIHIHMVFDWEVY